MDTLSFFTSVRKLLFALVLRDFAPAALRRFFTATDRPWDLYAIIRSRALTTGRRQILDGSHTKVSGLFR